MHENLNARFAVQNYFPFKISVVTSMELMQGARNKTEMKSLQNMISDFEIKILQIDDEISILAENLIAKYSLNHAMRLPDALIAATCLKFKEPLLTGNYKHFKCVPNLKIEKFVK